MRSESIARGVEDSVAYLASDAAVTSVQLDPYWPKWNSPWWHMVALFELGEASRIHQRVVTEMVRGVDSLLHFFPLRPEDAPGADLSRDIACHCALGSIVQVLHACGVEVDRELPWVSPWFVRYQMADGGLTCDESAYLVKDECPSSMVGTVPPMEAMLIGVETSAVKRAFVDRAAGFLIGRKLTEGSDTKHNADERVSAQSWPQVTFPRFYFYDVLRGLSALVKWAEATSSPLPLEVMRPVVAKLNAKWADGIVRVERHAFAGKTTVAPLTKTTVGARVAASSFPLLDAMSELGSASEPLTRALALINSRMG